MKTKFCFTALGLLAASCLSVLSAISASHGIANLRIAVVNSNVVLHWPSQTNQAFYVQYAPNLNPTSQWVTLIANLPAAPATNRTSFTHSNSVVYPPPCGTNSGGGSFNGPPSFSMMLNNGAQALTLNNGEAALVTPEGEVFTKEDFLPYPWNPLYQPKENQVATAKSSQGSGTASLQSEGGGENLTSDPCPSATTMGFYRVFIPAPRAVGDIFSVAQNSLSNQLAILANDTDPEENFFLLSNVVAATNGSLLYFDNAEPFWYTPTSNYWGMDTIYYALTNSVGGFAGTNAWVFVNKTGNHNPAAASLLFTLASNQTQVTFVALTNATDADGDSLSVVLLFQPAHGRAVTNSNGTITYTAMTNRVAQDSFTCVIADGRGGMVERVVRIVPQDTDEDGMPDIWEMQHGLNPTVAEANGDPDGDGFRNVAEYELAADPQAAQASLNFSIASNSVVAGFVNLVITNLSSDIDRQPIGLLVNGLPAADSFLSQRADGFWQLNWDTMFLTNGAYALRAKYQYSANGITNTAVGAPTTVLVSNKVRLDPLMRSFTDFLLVNLSLTTSTSAFRLDLLDDFGTSLVYAQGTTTNGKIQLYWDLTDGAGSKLAFGNVQAKLLLAPPGGLSTTTNRPILFWYLLERGSPATSMTIAWGWHQYGSTFNGYRDDMMLGGLINIFGDPSNFDAYTLRPDPFNVPYARSFRYDTDDDKKVLLQALKDSNSFFWVGHGNANGILGNAKKSSLVAGEVQIALENLSNLSSPKKPKVDKHPYHLVVLNGCETYTATWSRAFGIPFSPQGSTNSVLEYQFTGRAPRAFVGWTAEVDLPRSPDVSGVAHAEFSLALAYFSSYWMSGAPLNYCVDAFANVAVDYDFEDQDKWKISGCPDMRRSD